MADAKVTKRDRIEALIGIVSDIEGAGDLVDFLVHELELLEKRNARKGPTKVQEANAELKVRIVEAIGGSTVSAGEVAEAFGVSSQKATALLTQLKDEGVIVRTEDKGKAFFSVA